jgi:hypothetical protein
MSTSLKKIQIAKEFLTQMDVHIEQKNPYDNEAQVTDLLLGYRELIQLLVINEDAMKPSEYLLKLTEKLRTGK